MISSLFGKTRPVNYILVLSTVFIFFILTQLQGIDLSSGSFGFLWMIGSLSCLLLSLFLVNFIVQRNQLTAADSYAMLLYAQFLILFQDALRDPSVLIATFFLLLAQRRLISMKSMKNLKEKIFDAALWILTASLFVNWALFFVILVWVYIYYYIPKKFNYWLVPIAAGVTVGLISWSVFYLSGNPEYLFSHYTFSFEYFEIGNLPVSALIKITGFLLLVTVAGIIAFIKQGKSGQGRLIQLRLLVVVWILAVIVANMTGERVISTLSFAFFASSVFVARYVESIRKVYLRDIALYSVIALSILVFFLEWVGK